MSTPTSESTTQRTPVPSDTKARRRGDSIVAVAAAVLGGLLLGYLIQTALSSEFLGSGTRLVHACKNDPDFDAEACGPILEARAPARLKTSRELGVPNPSTAFQLSEEE